MSFDLYNNTLSLFSAFTISRAEQYGHDAISEVSDAGEAY